MTLTLTLTLNLTLTLTLPEEEEEKTNPCKSNGTRTEVTVSKNNGTRQQKVVIDKVGESNPLVYSGLNIQDGFFKPATTKAKEYTKATKTTEAAQAKDPKRT